jgi:Motility quorum-sensing regulator, toxin of MqsA
MCYHYACARVARQAHLRPSSGQRLAATEETRDIARCATRDSLAIGVLTGEVWETVANLQPTEFYKTMPSEEKPGTMLDVYRPTLNNIVIYLKLQIIQWRGTLLHVVKLSRSRKSESYQ